MNYMKLLWSSTITILLLTITGCGNSGGTADTVSGVAATGAPIMGTISLKDKNGVQRGPVTTDNDGKFSFDVTGLASPFILKADWIANSQLNTLYSAVTVAGTANINPLTNLSLQLATNSDPANIFGGQGAKPDTSLISNTSITAAQAKIKTLLAPLLTKYGINDFNPLYGKYLATPSNKLDAMLDVISFKIVNDILSINNKLDGSTIASGNIANILAITLDTSQSPDSTVLTDIKEITQRLGTLCSTMNLSTALTMTDTEALFISDPNYGTSNSHTRAEDMASIVAIFGPGGTNNNGKLKSIRNVRLVSDQTLNYANRSVEKVYLLNYDFIFDSGAIVHGNSVTLGKELSSKQWKFIGDPAGSNIGNNSGVVFTQETLPPLDPITPPRTDFSGVWVGSYSSSSGLEYPTTLYFQQNQDGTARGYMASNKYSGDFEYCLASDMTISCIVRSMDWRDSANLVITKTNEGITIGFSTGIITGSEVFEGTGTATRFDRSTEIGLRGVWVGNAVGPDSQLNQNDVVMVVADNVAGSSSKYTGGVFTTIRYATGGFVMNTEPWLFKIWGYDDWYGQGTLTTTGNPVSTLSFSIANVINYQPLNNYAITLNRIP